MNRRLPLFSILALLFTAMAGNLHADDFLFKTYTGPDGRTLPYRLLVPEHYDKTKKYPVVLFFHGWGECGTDNIIQLRNGAKNFDTPENREKFPCFVVVPQCPKDQRWVTMLWYIPSGKQSPEPTPVLQLALKCLDEVIANYSIDPARLYVAGLSMGGFAVWDCITRFPKRFAAAIAVCGGGDESTVTAAVAQVPVWAFHSSDDPTVPVIRSRHMVEAMTKAGGHPRYTEYQGLGHDAWTKAYAEPALFPWLFAQRLDQRGKS